MIMRQLLRDIAEIGAGQGAPQGDSSYCNDGIPFIKAGNMEDLSTGGSLDDIQKVSEEVARAHKLKLYPKGTVLFAKSGMSCLKGYVYVLPCETYVVSHLACITPHEDISEYLRYYFTYHKPNKLVKDPAYPSISLADIGNLEIDTKDAKERDSIISTLNSAEAIIDLRMQELRQLDNLIKARFVEMFGTVKNNKFGWAIKTIGDCCTLKSGTSLSTELENEGGEIPYVKVGDMNYPGNERYITTSSRYVSKETAGKGIFPIGSIIFPKRGGAIGTNKKRMTVIPICADLNVMGVSSNGDLLPEYLMAYFEMTDLGSLDNGSSVPQINNKDIAPLRICVPPLSAQREYKDLVKQVDKSKFAVQKALDKAQLLFDSLMQEYYGQN